VKKFRQKSLDAFLFERLVFLWRVTSDSMSPLRSVLL